MAVGHIPYDRIVWYGERAGMNEMMLRAFVRVIQRLDAAYLTELDAQKKG